jgi:hypothetical protein
MSRGANKLLAASSGHRVTTVTGMVRAYDGPFVRSLNLKAMGPEINAEILYKAQILRARVVEIPAHLDWSEQAERLAVRRVNLRVSATTRLLVFASFLFRPLVFFVVPGLVLGALAAATLGPLAWTAVGRFGATSGGFVGRLDQAAAGAWDLHPHAFAIGAVALVVAVQLLSLGVLATQAKRYFEELFHLGTHTRRRLERAAGVLPAPPERQRIDEPAAAGEDWVVAGR